MSTYKEEYQRAVQLLVTADVPEAELDAWYLLSHVTGFTRAVWYLRMGEDMPSKEAEAFRKLVEQRESRMPLQYITGSQEFMGWSFLVSPSTLIPRQDTEILVEEVAKVAQDKRVLDLCTGTGCIIISLAKLCRLKYAAGADISETAIETARRNAKLLEADVEFFCGDLFDALPNGESYDVIVSNPPYIPTEVIAGLIETLMPEVRDFEPVTALDGAEDGLKFYREIIGQAVNYLTPGGQLFFEIGSEQAQDVSDILSTCGYEHIRVIKDYAGLDRVVGATLAKIER